MQPLRGEELAVNSTIRPDHDRGENNGEHDASPATDVQRIGQLALAVDHDHRGIILFRARRRAGSVAAAVAAEVERRRVDAVALAARAGSVVEDVAQMRRRTRGTRPPCGA